MTDRPIIFSAPMVRALIAGTKTQTRRLVSPHTCTVNGYRVRATSAEWQDLDFTRAVVRQQSTLMLAAVGPDEAPPDPHIDVALKPPNEDMRYRVRSIIEADDRLWVRENHAFVGGGDPGILLFESDWRETVKRLGLENADKPPKWTPSIHMPRRISRLTLTVTDVRVQRLQEITDEDAIAEGARRHDDIPVAGFTVNDPPRWSMHAAPPGTDHCLSGPRWAFASFWNELHGGTDLHGTGPWDANPWVVAISFNVRIGNIDAKEAV